MLIQEVCYQAFIQGQCPILGSQDLFQTLAPMERKFLEPMLIQLEGELFWGNRTLKNLYFKYLNELVKRVNNLLRGILQREIYFIFLTLQPRKNKRKHLLSGSHPSTPLGCQMPEQRPSCQDVARMENFYPIQNSALKLNKGK